MSDDYLHIAVGVIFDRSGNNLLLSKRHENVPQGGLWEFPGGKLHQHESRIDALYRELNEELGIDVLRARPLIQVKHAYPDQQVFLDVWLVLEWTGVPGGREGQQIAWISKDRMQEMSFPDANLPIIKALSLPDLYGITPALSEYGHDFFEALQRKLDGGLQLLQFRARKLDKKATTVMLKRINRYCEEVNCRLLVNGLPQPEYLDYVAGVHLPSHQLMSLSGRCLGPEYLVAASCHNTYELQHACRIGINFAVLSPVCPTPSHADRPVLGWDRFASLVRDSTIPVFALGGLCNDDLQRAWEAGAQGISMIRGLWETSV